MSDGGSEQDKWKHKYLETLEQLEELEQKERDWQQTDKSLRHGLSRLALVSTGLNSGLDVQLTKLRRALQDQVKSDYLNEIVAKISDYLKTLDEQGQSDEVAPAKTPLGLLSDLLDAVEFPSSTQKRVKQLRRALKSRDAEEHLDQLVDEFSTLVVACFYQGEGAAAAPAPPVEEKQKSGWWKKVFGGAEEARPEDAEGTSEEPETPIAAPQETARAEAVPATPAPPVVEKNKRLEEAFLTFLENLSFPSQFSERVHALRDQLVAGLSADGVAAMVKGMVSLVMDTQRQLEQEKEELENFLKQLGERLQELDAMVDGAESNRLASLSSGRHLDEMVKAQVNDIEQTVQNVSDVVEMKGMIQGSLENIRQHLADNRKQEEVRQEELEQQLKGLNQRLVHMEAESERLRARLAEERVQAMTDPLTNVANRLGYEKRVAQEFARKQRYDSPLSMLVCDIDFFKRINDTYGHKAGDRALIAIAKSIDHHIRETDFLARVGGEEFVVLLPETTLEEAQLVAEKLRKGVENCSFVYDGQPVPITISGGVAEFAAGDKVDDVYVRADKALYRAKQQGRNRFLLQK